MSTTRHLALYVTEELGLTEDGAHVFASLVTETGASVFFDTLTEDGRHLMAAAGAVEDTTTKFHVTAQVM